MTGPSREIAASNDRVDELLDRLEKSKRSFGAHARRLAEKTLEQIGRLRFTQAPSLIRFHEALLFLRAYPHSREVRKVVDAWLKTFAERISQLRQAGTDLSPLDDPELSGVAGTTVTSNFSYDLVRWLARRHPAQVSIDWDWVDDEENLGATLPRFLPLLEDDALVEAHVPYRKWLRSAKGRAHELTWLIQQFESLPLPHQERGELYDSLKLHVRWKPSFRSTRTGMRLPTREVFYHAEALIRRRDVQLFAELGAPRIPFERLSRAKGEKILEMAPETSAVRYRELHGFTYGDPRRVLHAGIGRGVELFLTGVPPERRLPLRAYHAALIFKNGVPVGYFEGLSLSERMESGFNIYYTFREGETAWIYARVLRLCRQLLGMTVFSIDPYQIGHENEEGIESGAFWFYRKLGFRPVRADLLKIALAEEKKIAAKPSYRTPARVLRKLAQGPMIFQIPPAARSDWDRFEMRNLGLAVQRRMAGEFGGDARQIRSESARKVRQALGLSTRDWNEAELRALDNLALVLALIPHLDQWTRKEKQNLADIIRAKAAADESRYLRRMQKHLRLRAAITKLGS